MHTPWFRSRFNQQRRASSIRITTRRPDGIIVRWQRVNRLELTCHIVRSPAFAGRVSRGSHKTIDSSSSCSKEQDYAQIRRSQMSVEAGENTTCGVYVCRLLRSEYIRRDFVLVCPVCPRLASSSFAHDYDYLARNHTRRPPEYLQPLCKVKGFEKRACFGG